MPAIDVGDRVKFTKAPPSKPDLLNKTGLVIMMTDGTNYIVQLDNGESAIATVELLVKIS